MTTTTTTTPAEPARRPRIVPLVGDEPAMRDWADEPVARARTEGVELTGDNGLLTALVRQGLQTGLEQNAAADKSRCSSTPATLIPPGARSDMPSPVRFVPVTT